MMLTGETNACIRLVSLKGRRQSEKLARERHRERETERDRAK